MTPELWIETRAAFEEALELPPDQRAAFLDERVGSDGDLRAAVEKMLAAQTEVDGFLDPPELDVAPAPAAADGDRSGMQVGGYRIVRPIGAGGWGTVYEATQENPRRSVALKMMRLGLGTEAARRRFRYESELLARLRHPGIAQVFESGVFREGGSETPWFAMELLEDAAPLPEYARQHELDTNARLDLFLQVCDAVHHGHQRGVIHRDLKPGNILVEKGGTARVIDYGVACVEERDAEASLALTREGDVLGTLSYMSPEQVSGRHDDLDIRTDVYSLGVVLYELLTGRPPHDLKSKSLTEITRIICDSEPRRPSETVGGVARELDWIVLKAMATEPERRYGTVEMLARDVARFQRHEPVLAGAPTTGYYVRKFVRRHRLVVSAAAVIFVTLIVGIIAVSIQKGIADAAIDEFDMLANVEHLNVAVAEEKALYPPWPHKIVPMVEWLEDRAGTVLESLPKLRSTVATLRTRALPVSATEEEARRQAHPRAADVLRLRGQIGAMRRAQATFEGEPQAVVDLADEMHSLDAAQLAYRAWVAVSPRRTLFGEEVTGLAFARLAAQKAGPQLQAHVTEVLAWALNANGLDEEAFEQADRLEQLGADAEALRELRVSIVKGRRGGRPRLIEALQEELKTAEREVAGARVWRFEEQSDQFLHDTLTALIARIETFEAETVHGVLERLIWARRMQRMMERDRSRWEEAREALRAADGVGASSLYAAHPIDLHPQVGLVPIGRNPVTGLLEFHHLGTRDTGPYFIKHRPDGTVDVRIGTGVVFVLVPGGTFMMGAQEEDPNAPNYTRGPRAWESPVHEVELAPFFMARHEMTQGQWERLSEGALPSWSPAGRFDAQGRRVTRTHPVDNVSWRQCNELFGPWGLTMPTEAQWEYAARAGTTTPWFTGTDKNELDQYANLADATAQEYTSKRCDTELDDGWNTDAPVGSFLANPFGLHDVYGNVFELCLDFHESYLVPPRSGDGLRAAHGQRVARRGGSHADRSHRVRSASRVFTLPDQAASRVGVRPARELSGPAEAPGVDVFTGEFHRRVARLVRPRVVVDLKVGDDRVRRALDPTLMPITVGAWVTSTGEDGVIAAHGGHTRGYALYVKDGVPRFAVRGGDELLSIGGGTVEPGRRTHLVATIDAEETMRLYVDGVEVASGAGVLMARQPREGMSVGRDAITPVGDYSGEYRWRGEIAFFRLYWGVVPPSELRAWAAR